MSERNINKAIEHYEKAHEIYHRMNTPSQEATAWYQLGRAYQEDKRWEDAENAFRESARIEHLLGHRIKEADSWAELAIVLESAGRPCDAEDWYHMALRVFQEAGDQTTASILLNNLADLLQSQPERLSEARQLAEQSLAIKQTQDPNAAAIWTTYHILADILEKQQDPNGSAHYRRLARQARFNFPGTRYQLKGLDPVILGVVAAVQQPELKEELDPVLAEVEQGGWADMVASIRRILNGERDEDALCAQLDHFDKGVIIMTILRGLEDPSVLEGWG